MVRREMVSKTTLEFSWKTRQSDAYARRTSNMRLGRFYVRTINSALQMHLLYYADTIVRLPNDANQARAYFKMKTVVRSAVRLEKSWFPVYDHQRLPQNLIETGKVHS